jgi:hypothetical protein
VEKKVIIELKSLERLQPVHSKQLLTYLRLIDCRLGLLINFGENLLKDGFKRVVNALKTPHATPQRRNVFKTPIKKKFSSRRRVVA